MGSSVTVMESQSKLIVTSPFSVWMMLGLGVFTIWPLWIVLSKRPFPTKQALFYGALCLAVYGFLPSYTRMTLDRAQSTATFRRYNFFHFTTDVYPLHRIYGASVRSGSTTALLQVQLDDGHIIPFSEFNQSDGKDEAAFAINKFIGRN